MATEHNSAGGQGQSLTDRVLRGMFWLFAGTGAQMALQTVVLMILARLLVPADFGIVAAAVVVTTFMDTFAELGIGSAITQRPRLSEAHVRTAFTFSLFAGFLLAACAPLYVPIVTWLLDMPELGSFLYLAALKFPLRGVRIVADALMVRELRFSVTARIEVFSYAFGYGVVGIILALNNYGGWALLIAMLAQTGLRSVIVLIVQRHPMALQFDQDAFRELMFFGNGFTLARVGNMLALQGDNLVIGRWLGAEALGLYGRAYQLMVTPANLFGQVLDRVLFPAMAKRQSNRERLATSYRRGVTLVALLTLPITVVLYLVAPEIIEVLLGTGWAAVVAPFQVLVFGTLFRTSYKVSDSLARATGAVYRRAWRQYVYAGMVIGGAWIGHHWGVTGVAVGVTIALISNFLLMAQLSLRLTSMTWRQFATAHMPPLLLSALLVAFLLPLTWLLRSYGFASWFILGITGVSAVLLIMGLAVGGRRFFLGEDGVWILRTLADNLPKGLRSLKVVDKRLNIRKG